MFSRSPALMAMTAAGLDFVSSGRFILGLGASGPQVVTDWHGVPYDRPLPRTRETIEVCRKVWTRERLQYEGRRSRFLRGLTEAPQEAEPAYAFGNSDLHCSARAQERRARRGVRRGVDPALLPSRQATVWGEALADGARQRNAGLAPWKWSPAGRWRSVTRTRPTSDQRCDAPPRCAVCRRDGSPGQNFYNDLFRRYGYESEATAIQKLYLSGHKKEAEALIPEDFLRATSMVGDEDHVRDRIEAYKWPESRA